MPPPPLFSPLAGTKCAHHLAGKKYSLINKSQMAGKWQQSMLLKIIDAKRLQPETAVENITAVALYLWSTCGEPGQLPVALH